MIPGGQSRAANHAGVRTSTSAKNPAARMVVFNLNLVLQRLAGMLPDEMLREETKLFTTLNRYLLLMLVCLMGFYFVLMQFEGFPPLVLEVVRAIHQTRHWILVFLILLPVAMTMTLTWKLKEAILENVFDHSE